MKVDQSSSVSSIQNYEHNTRNQGHTRSNKNPSNSKANTTEMINELEVKKAVSSLNGFIEPLQTNLKFVFHDELNEYYVTVVNPSTDEIIREIPPKKMLDMYAAMAEYMGILIDEKI